MLRNILIIDSQPLMAESLVHILSDAFKEISLNYCWQPSQISYAVTKFKPTLVILDNEMGKPDALTLYKKIKSQTQDAKILIFSHNEDYGTVKNYFKLGANGYLLRSSSIAELLEAIEQVEKGEMFLDNSLKQTLACQLVTKKEKKKPLQKITAREKEILQLVIDEYTTKEIAKLLFITPETVETHRNHLIQKFDVRNTAGLVRETLLRGALNGFASQGKP